MNISCQSIMNVKRPKQGAADLCGAGLNRVYLSIYVKFPDAQEYGRTEKSLCAYTPDTIRKRYEGLMAECGNRKIQIACIKAPVIPKSADMDTALPMLEASIMECVELCRMAGCQYLQVTMPSWDGKDRETEKRTVCDLLRRTVEKAHAAGVMLLLKNQAKDMGGHLVRGFCAEASEAAAWTDRLNVEFGRDAFGFCVDMGICNICGNDVQTFMNTLGNRIKAVILRDNDGHNDASMLPFTYAYSGTDWLGAVRGLRDIGFDGELMVDFSSTYASFSPLLRPALYPLVKRTAEYFKWQIEIESTLKKYKRFVLFGAGNMCRNYMKCYGEKYPPLFTCDNNPQLWGTDFEGLAVKNPEELNNLPEDCCVVICNIYYREIEKQLHGMGIKNIGYFNDEYMPSFYFDRLDRENE